MRDDGEDYEQVAGLKGIPVAWMYLIRPTRPGMLDDPTEAESSVMRDHFAYLRRLRDNGPVLLAGPSLSGEDTFGIIVLDIDDETAATAIMESDPSVTSGVMSAELRPFRISVLRESEGREREGDHHPSDDDAPHQ